MYVRINDDDHYRRSEKRSVRQEADKVYDEQREDRGRIEEEVPRFARGSKADRRKEGTGGSKVSAGTVPCNMQRLAAGG